MPKKRAGLQFRITVTVLVAATLFAAASLTASYLYLKRSMFDFAGTNLSGIAKSIARGVESFAARENQQSASGAAIGLTAGKPGVSPAIGEALSAYSGIDIGKNGNIAFVEERGYLVSCRGTEPFANRLCSNESLQKLLESRGGWSVSDGVYLHEDSVLLALCKINFPLKLQSEKEWYAVVAIDEGEVLGKLNAAMMAMTAAALILISVLAIVITVMARAFVIPAAKLRGVLERIGRGDLNSKAELNTGEEFEGLADSINSMVKELRLSTASVDELQDQAAELKKAREDIARLEKIKAGVVKGLSEINIRSTARDAEKAAKLSAGLIEIMGIEDGNGVFKSEAIDIKALIKNLLFDLEPKIRAKGLDLKLELPHARTEMMADKARIVQIFNLLIENAIRSTTKGQITISAREADGFIESSVSDTGDGIPKEDIQHTFEWFGIKGGVGLELPIVKDLVEMHRGSISVISQSGHGTTFTFRIPKQI